MKTAIIYCRVSTDKQGQNGDSLDIQERDCKDYCKRMQIDVVEVFREQFTGTSIQRPALTEVFKFLKKHKGEVDYCIVHKIDRSTRGGLGDYYEIKKEIESHGTTLKDTYGVIGDDINVVHFDNVDTSQYDWARFNPSDMAVSMMVLNAEQERAGILRRTIPQEIRNTQNGYISRQSHFGYKNEKICTPEGKLKVIYIPDQIESKWIQTMFELRASGNFSDMEIVNRINLMGYKSRTQKKWNREKTRIIGITGGKSLDIKQLQKYIKYPIYAGVMLEKWTGNKPIRASFAGIVSIDTFNQANRGLIQILEHTDGNVSMLYGDEKLPEKPEYKRMRFHSEYPFSRAIKCPLCEGHLTPNKSQSKNGQYHYYYQCKGKFGQKHKNYTVKKDLMNETVIEFLSRLDFHKERYDLFKKIVADVWNEGKHELNKEKDRNIESIQKLEESKVTLLRNIEKFIDFPEILHAKNDELVEIKKKIEILKNRKITESNDKSQSDFLEFAKNILTHISNMLHDEKNEQRVGVIFDIIFEECPTFEKIQSNTPALYPIFALESKKRAIDDSLVCMNNDGKYLWQPRRESNSDRGIWSPEF